jgi:hypothetical protein
MTDDTNDAVFGQRAGGPALTSPGFEPPVRGLMTHMSRINEGDQDVDIKQECHSDSSRSAFTVSSVTTARSSWRQQRNPVSRHRGLRPVQGAAGKIGYNLADAPMLLLGDRPRGGQHIVIESQCRAHVALTSEASNIKHQNSPSGIEYQACG